MWERTVKTTKRLAGGNKWDPFQRSGSSVEFSLALHEVFWILPLITNRRTLEGPL